MMTLVARLCALCAMSALVEMALGESRFKGMLRAIFGMMMIEAALAQLLAVMEALKVQRDLQGVFDCLMM